MIRSIIRPVLKFVLGGKRSLLIVQNRGNREQMHRSGEPTE